MTDRIAAWLRTADARWLLAMFALAFIVRLLAVAYAHPNPRDGRFDDSVWYDTTARHLAAGDGYVFDPTVWKLADGTPIFAGETQQSPTALWPPGYPLTLAAVYKLTGDSLNAARLLNVIFGSLTVALVFLIARRLFDRTAAIFAAGALAVLPAHVFFTAILLSETYYGFLLAAVLAICVYLVFGDRRPHILLMLGLGALTAFAGYVRGEFMAYGAVIALLVLLRWRRDALLPLVGLAFGAMLVVGPWTLRNEITMDEAIVGTTGAGRVSFQGHNPAADGWTSLAASNELEARFAGLSRKEIELKSNREGSKLAREWALDHPLDELRLVPRRLYYLFRSDDAGITWLQSNKPTLGSEGADKLIRLSNVTFFGLIAVALAAAPLWWRPRDQRFWVVFGIVPFYMLAFGVLFIGDPRYHYALYIPITIFAAPGLAALFRVTVEHWRQVFGQRSLMSILRTRAASSR